VKVYKLSPEGKEQILHVIEPNEAFAEAAVFAGHRFPAHADAMEASKALFLPRQAFLGLVERHPSLALNMLADLSRRLHRFANLIESLSLKEVPGRLAAHLLYLSERQDDRDELVLDLSKVQLASLLGTIPETLSRVLAKMAREGLIEVQEGRNIRLLDRESLEELATGERRLGATT
jgi:CRP/FNR family transcriptional regulator, dissimilatory nitrate respiration regulator